MGFNGYSGSRFAVECAAELIARAEPAHDFTYNRFWWGNK